MAEITIYENCGCWTPDPNLLPQVIDFINQMKYCGKFYSPCEQEAINGLVASILSANGTIIYLDSINDRPDIGTVNILYVDKSTGQTFVWNVADNAYKNPFDETGGGAVGPIGSVQRSDGNGGFLGDNNLVFNGIVLDVSGRISLADAMNGNEATTKNQLDIAISGITKTSIGLGNVDNTSDANKPVSTAQAAADANILQQSKDYSNSLVVGLWDDRGSYNASSNLFPSTGGSGNAGAILKGDIWTVSVTGALGGISVEIGDTVRALVDSPAQTSANWGILQNNIGYVPENVVNKKTDLTSPNNTDYPTTQAVANALSGVSSNLPKYAKATSAVITYIQDRYQAFPAIAMDRDKYAFAECIWKDAPSHVADGNLKWCRSVDGFKTFTDPVTITVGGTPLTNATNGMIGFGRNGRSVIAYSTGGDLTTLYFAKCDNHSNVFTATTTMTLPSGIDFLFPFGKTIIMPESGELRMLGYCKETALTPTSTCYFKSTDNGDSWTFGGIILHGGPMSGPTYFYPIGPSESDWDIVSTDGTDVGTKIFLIARDDVNYRHIQLFTNDGGLSWSNTIQTASAFAFGDTIPGSPDAFWPCTVLCYGGKAYAIHGVRMNPATPQNFSTRLFVKDALTVYNNPNNWNPTTDYYTHYRPQSFFSYSYIDWGYPWITVSPYGQLSAVLYDGDPRGAISTSIAPTIVIKTIDLENGNYFSTYASANQTIAPSIEAEITFDKPWLDSENSGHYIPSDGNYTISFKCKLGPDATGTYRQISVYGISKGQEDHVAGTGKTIFGQKAIAPSSIAQLNNIQIDCSGYFIAGTIVRPMLIHDASGSITLDNSDPLTRATLTFKKID